jgi:hypothetical protein
MYVRQIAIHSAPVDAGPQPLRPACGLSPIDAFVAGRKGTPRLNHA